MHCQDCVFHYGMNHKTSAPNKFDIQTPVYLKNLQERLLQIFLGAHDSGTVDNLPSNVIDSEDLQWSKSKLNSIDPSCGAGDNLSIQGIDRPLQLWTSARDQITGTELPGKCIIFSDRLLKLLGQGSGHGMPSCIIYNPYLSCGVDDPSKQPLPTHSSQGDDSHHDWYLGCRVV